MTNYKIEVLYQSQPSFCLNIQSKKKIPKLKGMLFILLLPSTLLPGAILPHLPSTPPPTLTVCLLLRRDTASFSSVFLYCSMGDLTLSRPPSWVCISYCLYAFMCSAHPLYQPGVCTSGYVPLLLLSEMHGRLHLLPSWPQREAGLTAG